jgi:hypothetical protein
MKIVQQTPNLLILRLRPIFLWIFGAIFASVGLFMTFNGKTITLTCKRTESTFGSCELIESGVLGSQARVIPLNILQGAKVKEQDGGDISTYQVIIFTRNGEVPFASYSSFDEGQAIVSHINQFLKIPQETSLTQQEDDRLNMFLIGGLFFTCGLVPLTARIVTCVFNKTLNTLTVKRQGFLGTEVIEHGLREIKNVLVEELTDSEGSNYRVSIVLVSGDRLPLTSYYSSGRKSQQRTVSCIKNFLNIEN